jgi:ABC-type antimicrobial peptide transport system permease subunit
MAYEVSQRTRELGIRISVGARQNDVLKLILGQALVLTATAMTGGVIVVLAMTRLAANLICCTESVLPIP